MSDDRSRRLPLYDTTAPIVCTLAAGEVQERRRLLGWLRSNHSRVDRDDHGLLLHFPADVDVEQLRHFATVEKRCCAFWGFEVECTATSTTLRWDAPPAAHEITAHLLAWLGGDESTDVLDLL